MKQKLIALLLSVSALALSACAGMDEGLVNDLINSADVIAGALTDDSERQPDSTPTEDDAGTEDAAVPEDDSLPDDPAPQEDDAGTVSGSDDAQYEDGSGAELDEDGTYSSKEDVSLYLHLYDHLPDNYITKNEARNLGWTGGSVERYAPGCAIGGDRFGNREGLLPDAGGRTYYECDIDTIGADSRGAKRIIFSNDGLIYYTDDHYESFTLLYGEE